MFGAPATTRSDVFAFGVVVHEMLTGSHPFSRGTVTDTATAIVRDDAPPLGPAVAGLPTGVAKIIERCLEKQPADRPGSARDLALYLEAVGTTPDQTSTAPQIDPAEARRLRVLVLAIACGLLALFSLAPWIIVRTMSSRAVTAAIDADLTRAEQVARRVQRDRFNSVSLTARLVASFPELKALFATDSATVRDYLASYQQRNSGVPLLIALGADSKVIARTDNLAPGAGDDDWIGALLGGHGEPIVVQIGGRPYHAAAAPVEAGGNVFGYIVGAAPVDAEFAGALRKRRRTKCSSSPAARCWRRRCGPPRRGGRATSGAGREADRIARPASRSAFSSSSGEKCRWSTKPAVSAVLLASRDEADAPFAGIQITLAVLALVGLAAAAIGGVFIARALGTRSTSQNRTPRVGVVLLPRTARTGDASAARARMARDTGDHGRPTSRAARPSAISPTSTAGPLAGSTPHCAPTTVSTGMSIPADPSRHPSSESRASSSRRRSDGTGSPPRCSIASSRTPRPAAQRGSRDIRSTNPTRATQAISAARGRCTTLDDSSRSRCGNVTQWCAERQSRGRRGRPVCRPGRTCGSAPTCHFLYAAAG
jgi:hypothetical protein